MMIIAIGLISEAVLADLRAQFGGFTPEAAYELFPKMLHDPPTPGLRKRWPKSADAGIDSRYAARGRRALQLVAARHAQNPKSAFAEASCGAVLFFSPLVPKYGGNEEDLNDSGGTGGGGPILSPQRCRDLLEIFRAVDLAQLEAAINDYSGLFAEVGPAYTFKDGRSLIEYLQSYATILEEAVADQLFYTSFFT